MSHEGWIQRDNEHAATIARERRCGRCGGTGNEFYAMYRRCSDCGGSGVAEPSTPPPTEETE